jgi:hypothetical protein
VADANGEESFGISKANGGKQIVTLVADAQAPLAARISAVCQKRTCAASSDHRGAAKIGKPMRKIEPRGWADDSDCCRFAHAAVEEFSPAESASA